MIDKILSFRLFQTNLKTKLILAFILPVMASMTLISYVHTTRESTEWKEISEEHAINSGYLVLDSLKHAMLANDQDMQTVILQELENGTDIKEVFIVSNSGMVLNSVDETRQFSQLLSGCVECHTLSADERPQAMYFPDDRSGILRVAIPIVNEIECQECHVENESHLGVLLIDNKTIQLEEHLKEDLWINYLISAIMLLAVFIISYAMIQWLVERRIRVVDDVLKAYAAGDSSARIPMNWRTGDEITRLAKTFNEMVDALEQYQKEQRVITIVRQRAVLDERERLARELHDGVAQVLGYLMTKVTAITLLLEQKKIDELHEHIGDMDRIINKENLDVRAAIAGLQSISFDESTLVKSLHVLVERCQQLCEMDVSFVVDRAAEDIRLDPETEFHLGRIVQESISNIRKHAEAKKINLSVEIIDEHLVISVGDDGVGFNPWHRSHWQYPHFGLNSMSERSEKIGASFSVLSEPGQGTRIIIKLKIGE